MTDEQQASLKHGREILAQLDTQFARMGRMIEVQSGQRIAVNVEEETRLNRLLRSFTNWAKEAHTLGLDIEKEFGREKLQQIHETIKATRKPTVRDPLLNAFLQGDLREDGPRPPKPKPSQMPLENWPP